MAYKYDALTNGYVEMADDAVNLTTSANAAARAESAPEIKRPASPAVSVTRTPRPSAAEREAAFELALQRHQISETMSKIASGEYVVQGLNTFTRESIADLARDNYRPATDADASFETMYIPDVKGNPRPINLCALEPKAEATAEIADAANDAEAAPEQILLASEGKRAGPAENPAPATTAQRRQASAPGAAPA